MTSKLSQESLDMHEKATSSYQKHIKSAEEYLSERGISLQVAAEYRLGVAAEPYVPEHESYTGRLCIPYLTKGGIVNMKFRCLEDHSCKDVKHAKYMGLPGRNNLYNVSALFAAGDTIAVSEGEIDALVLSANGVPSVGIPGATNWQQHYKCIFDDFTRIVAFCDGDEAGRKWGEMLRERVGAIPVALPTGTDVNAMIVRGELEWLTSKM